MRDRSRLSIFLEQNRLASEHSSYREYAKYLDDLFDHTYIKYIEDAARCPSREKWLAYATLMGLDKDDALDMLQEHKFYVKQHHMLRRLYKNKPK
jgi:ethanolamine utilization cobalamin adenosyltransferase